MIQYFDLRLKGLLFLCGLWVSVFFFFLVFGFDKQLGFVLWAFYKT